MTAPRFCPACGRPAVDGARFCGGCGADLGATGALPGPAPVPPSALTPAPLPEAPTPASARRRGRRGPALAAFALLAVAALVAGAVAAGLSAGATSLYPPVAPDPSAVALTSPPPAPPAGLADAGTPAYRPGSGFTPDAVRVLTVTVLRLSLEQYRAATGSYPAMLAELFPRYAPNGPDGRPMARPPSVADGYVYLASSVSAYTLSVRLASGQSYTTANPAGPMTP